MREVKSNPLDITGRKKTIYCDFLLRIASIALRKSPLRLGNEDKTLRVIYTSMHPQLPITHHHLNPTSYLDSTKTICMNPLQGLNQLQKRRLCRPLQNFIHYPPPTQPPEHGSLTLCPRHFKKVSCNRGASKCIPSLLTRHQGMPHLLSALPSK